MNSMISQLRELERTWGVDPGQMLSQGLEWRRCEKSEREEAVNGLNSNILSNVQTHVERCLPMRKAGVGFTNKRRLAVGQPLLPPQRLTFYNFPAFLEENPRLSDTADEAMRTICSKYDRALHEEADVLQKIAAANPSSRDLEGEEGLLQQLKYSTGEAEDLRRVMRSLENLYGEELRAFSFEYRRLVRRENNQYPWRLSGLQDRGRPTDSIIRPCQPATMAQADNTVREQQENIILDIHQTWNDDLERPKQNVQPVLGRLKDLSKVIAVFPILGDNTEYYALDYVVNTRKLTDIRTSLERLGDRIEQAIGKQSITEQEYTELVELCATNKNGLQMHLQNLDKWLGGQDEVIKADIQRLQSDEEYLETMQEAQRVNFWKEFFSEE